MSPLYLHREEVLFYGAGHVSTVAQNRQTESEEAFKQKKQKTFWNIYGELKEQYRPP